MQKTIERLGCVWRNDHPEQVKKEIIESNWNARSIILEFFYFKKYFEKTKDLLSATNAKGTR